MKYDNQTTLKMVEDYKAGTPVEIIADSLAVPTKSIIAKLSSLGVYQKKKYVNKRGESPVKKEVLIEKIAQLLDKDILLLESLEKCNKNVLAMIIEALESVGKNN
jgi:hypothetical protein